MLEHISAMLTLFVLQTQLNLSMLGTITLILFVSFILTSIFPFLYRLGIIPRHIAGLPGIVLAPLLHANFNHLFFNLIPLIVLSDFILLNGQPYFYTVTLYITLISGGFIWCFAKPGIHLGASAVITGYWALLVTNIYQQGTLMAICLGIVCLYYFVGIFYSLLSSEKGVSWEGHVFGFLAGIATSWLVVIPRTF